MRMPGATPGRAPEVRRERGGGGESALHGCVRVCACVCVCVGVGGGGRAHVRAPCVSACVGVGVRACVRACWLCVCVYVLECA